MFCFVWIGSFLYWSILPLPISFFQRHTSVCRASSSAAGSRSASLLTCAATGRTTVETQRTRPTAVRLRVITLRLLVLEMSLMSFYTENPTNTFYMWSVRQRTVPVCVLVLYYNWLTWITLNCVLLNCLIRFCAWTECATPLTWHTPHYVFHRQPLVIAAACEKGLDIESHRGQEQIFSAMM